MSLKDFVLLIHLIETINCYNFYLSKNNLNHYKYLKTLYDPSLSEDKGRQFSNSKKIKQ